MKIKLSYPNYVLAILFLIANVLQNSSLLLMENRDYVKYIYAIQVLVLSAYLAKIIYKRRFAVALSILAYLIYIIFECINFSTNTSSAINIDSSYPYLLIISAVIFVDKNISLRKICQYLYLISIAYAAVYIVIALFFPGFYSPHPQFLQALKIFGRDHYKDSRLVMSTSYIAFGFVYAIASLRSKFRWSTLASLILLAIAIILSNYRYMAVALVPVAGILIVPWLYQRGKWLAPVAFIGATCLAIAGAFIDRFNFYRFFSFDASGLARAVEYDGAKDIIAQHIWFGLGIPASRDDLNAAVQLAHPLFYDDIGAMGILCGFGILGLLLYSGLGLLLCTFSLPPKYKPQSWELSLIGTGMFLSLYAFTAPTFWGADGSVFAAIIVCYHFRNLKHFKIGKIQKISLPIKIKVRRKRKISDLAKL